jgi:hypothetical protein
MKIFDVLVKIRRYLGSFWGVVQGAVEQTHTMLGKK